MKQVATILQALAALAVLIAAVPVTLNQFAIRAQRAEVAKRAAEHASLAEEAAKAKDPALAAQAWSDALSLEPGDARYRAGLLQAHVDAILQDAGVIPGDPLRLHAELADAVTRTPTPDARVLVAFGRVLQYRGQPDQAKARFDQARTADPSFPDAHLYLGDVALKEGKLDLAAGALEKALDLDPNLVLGTFALGQVRLKQERYDDAIELLQVAAKKIPNGKVYLALGEALSAKEKWPEAEAILEKALVLDRTLVTAHRPLAEAYVQNKKFEAAVGAFRLAYERAHDLEAFRRLGRMLARADQPEDAVQVFSELRSLFPDDLEAHCQIGANAMALGQFIVAQVAFKRCLALGDDDPKNAKMLKVAKAQLGQVERRIAQDRDAAAEAEKKKTPRKR